MKKEVDLKKHATELKQQVVATRRSELSTNERSTTFACTHTTTIDLLSLSHIQHCFYYI